jgi:hypothetical protein
LEFNQSISHVLGSEAVGIWTFDDCSANDSSGYNNNGTITGAQCNSDTPYSVVGQDSQNSMSFDGNDYINISTHIDFNADPGDQITLSAWFKGGTQSSSYGCIFWKEGGCIGWSIRLHNNGYVTLNFSTGEASCSGMSYYQVNAGDRTYNDNQWHYVVGVIDRPNEILTIYVDGESKESISIDNTKIGAGGSTKIGTVWNNTYYFTGLIDNVAIYTQSLNQSQIQQHYAEGLQTHPNF